MALPRTLISLVLVALIAGAAWLLIDALYEGRPEPAPAPPRDPGPVPVRVREVATRAIPLEVGGFGTLLAARRARLASEVGGKVVAVLEGWRPGAAVEAGQVLLSLDPEILDLEARRAEAGVEEARAVLAAALLEIGHAEGQLETSRTRREVAARELERLRGLEGEGIASPSLLDAALAEDAAASGLNRAALDRVESARSAEATARTRLAHAELSLELARVRRGKAEILAPFAGHLAGRAPAPGTWLAPGEPVAELLDIATLHLSLPVHELELVGIRVGLAVRVDLPSRPGLHLDGRVRAVGVEADLASRAVSVEVEVRNPAAGTAPEDGASSAGDPLAAGQFARAVIELGVAEGALVVDRRHLRWDSDRAIAFVLEDDLARRRDLDLGRSVGEGFLVDGGLAPGELLITHPLDRLADGARCRIEGDGEGEASR